MFKLYFNKKENKIEISPMGDTLMVTEANDKITLYNEYHYICNDRKSLMEKANEIKSNWIAELEKELNEIKEIKIKNKY